MAALTLTPGSLNPSPAPNHLLMLGMRVRMTVNELRMNYRSGFDQIWGSKQQRRPRSPFL